MPVPPVVTVSIPTRNRAHLLRTCLASVLEQSLEEIEVVVADNASTDDTAAVVAGIDDPRVSYVRHRHDVGLHGNLTRCLRLGSAPYLVVLSDDDLILPGNLERKVRFLEEHPSAGFVHSAFLRIGPSGEPVPGTRTWAGLHADTVESGFDFVWRAFERGGLVCPPSVVMRRAAVLGERFEAEDGPYCDNGLWLRIARAHDVGYLAQPLSGFRVHAESQTVQYGNARIRHGRYLLTPAHAAAVRLPNERFLLLPGHDPQTVRELRALLAAQDRRLRLGLRLHATLPRRVVRMLRRAPGQAAGADRLPGVLDPEVYYGSML